MLKEYIQEFIDDQLYKFGYIKEEERILRSLPEVSQKKARNIINKLGNLKNLSNVGDAFELSAELCSIFKKNANQLRTRNKGIKDAVRLIGGDQGYRPAMARLYGLFKGHPFAIYAFIARHHWAVRAALGVIRSEIVNDGFELKAQKGTTKKRLREVYKQLKAMGIFKLRLNLACHLKLYGNAWVLPHKNLLGSYGFLELLAPPRILPITDPVTDKIVGWDYRVGSTVYRYDIDDIYHIWEYNVDNYKDLGDPCLTPAILPIEADLAADSYNNQIFQKGGLFGIIINIKNPDSDPISRDEDDVVEDLQERIDSQFSGVKASGSTLVGSNIENVYNLSTAGKDMGYKDLHTETAKTVANCFGMPPEKIAISRSSSQQYVPSLVEDSVNASFDKTINALTSEIDDFLNDKILAELLGITDVRIVASGRYGSLTKNAAETIKTLADSGPIITVNQALERVLGWEELPSNDPRGQWILDNSKNRDPEAVPLESEPDRPELEFGKSMFSKNRFIKDITRQPDSVECDFIRINMRGEVKYYAEVHEEDKESKRKKEKGSSSDQN